MEKSFPTIIIFTGIILCLIGFIIIFLGSLATVSGSGGNISAGGIIFIGPFPIVFGAGEYGLHLIWLSIVIAIIMIVLSYIFVKNVKNIW